jgi:hypothetical protein
MTNDLDCTTGHVIPAKAGIYYEWIPAFAGMTEVRFEKY